MAKSRLSRLQSGSVYSGDTGNTGGAGAIRTTFCGRRRFSLAAVTALILTALISGVGGAHFAFAAEPTTTWPSMPRSTCEEAEVAAQDMAKDIFQYCDTNKDLKSCVSEKLNFCQNARKEAAASIRGGGDDDSSTGKSCEEIREISTKCPGLMAVTPEEADRNRKNARQLRDDLRKERGDARKDDRDNQKNSQDEMNKLDDEALKNDQEWRKERKKLSDKLQDDLAEMENEGMKGVKDAQTQYDQIDVEYIKARDELRRRTSPSHETELAWNTQCRSAADSVASRTEEELDKRIAAENAIARNYQFSSLAGKRQRDLKLKRQRILNKFNEFLAKCLRGDADPGAAAKMKLSQVKNELADSQANQTDKSARLEKLRAQIIENLNNLQQSLSKRKQLGMQRMQEDIQMLDQDHNMNSQRIEKRKQQAMQNQMMQNMQQMMGQKEQNQRLNDLMDEEAYSSAEYACWSKMDKSEIEEARSTMGKAQRAFNYFTHTCDGSVLPAPSSSCKPIPSKICETIKGVAKDKPEAKKPAPDSAPVTKTKAKSGKAGSAQQ